MSLRYQKRVNLGKGVGLNLSRSGISSSYRGRWGSIGSTGFSIRTGIPGLSFRKYSSRKKGDGLVLFVMLLFIALAWLLAVVVWNLVRFLVHLMATAWRRYRAWQLDREINLHAQQDDIIHVFAGDLVGLAEGDDAIWQMDWLVKEKTAVKDDQVIAVFSTRQEEVVVRAEASGVLFPIAVSGQALNAEVPIYKIKKQKK